MNMLDFLSSIEPYIEFFFLILTVCLTYGRRKQKLPFAAELALAMLAYLLIYGTVDRINTIGIIAYIATTLLIAMIFSLMVQSHDWKFSGIITLNITYIFLIICAKSSVLMVSNTTTFTEDGNLLHSITLYLIFYALLAACSVFFILHPLPYQKGLPVRYWILMVLSPIAASISMLANTGISYAYGIQASGNKIIACISLLTILLTYYLSYTLLTTWDKLMLTNRINQQILGENASLKATTNMIEQVRKEKHELKNTYFYISTLVKEQKFEKLEEFLDTELAYRMTNIEEFHTGHQMLDVLLTQKLGEARNLGIHTMADILIPPEIDLEQNDVCSLILNLLNNAIEGSRNIKDPDIQVYMSVMKNYLKVRIQNRTNLTEVPSDGNMPTSKADSASHGLGIKIVREVVRKHDGSINFSVQSEYFTVDCILQVTIPHHPQA